MKNFLNHNEKSMRKFTKEISSDSNTGEKKFLRDVNMNDKFLSKTKKRICKKRDIPVKEFRG